MWSSKRWGNVGSSQSMFQRNSSLDDVNRTQHFARALQKMFWLSELIPIPSCKIHKIRKICLVCFPMLCWCRDSFANVLSVSAGLHDWHPARPQPPKCWVRSSCYRLSHPARGNVSLDGSWKMSFKYLWRDTLAHLSVIRKTIQPRAMMWNKIRS